jgi:hypothetical protein
METGLTLRHGPHFYTQLPPIPLIFSSGFRHKPVELFDPVNAQITVLLNRDRYIIIETDRASMVFVNIWKRPNAMVLKGLRLGLSLESLIISKRRSGLNGELKAAEVLIEEIYGGMMIARSLVGGRAAVDGPNKGTALLEALESAAEVKDDLLIRTLPDSRLHPGEEWVGSERHQGYIMMLIGI